MTHPTVGMIISRTCPTCGHHEIGYVDSGNTFHPLKPGDMVQVMPAGMAMAFSSMNPEASADVDPASEDALKNLVAWAPEPVRSDRRLRMKYGVLVDRDMIGESMPAGLYAIAFRQKLHRLISEEKFTPLPVVFERFFGVPQLATGNALQMAESLLEELDELSRPIELVQNWISKKDPQSLAELVHPRDIRELADTPPDDDAFKKELVEQSLIEFFELF